MTFEKFESIVSSKSNISYLGDIFSSNIGIAFNCLFIFSLFLFIIPYIIQNSTLLLNPIWRFFEIHMFLYYLIVFVGLISPLIFYGTTTTNIAGNNAVSMRYYDEYMLSQNREKVTITDISFSNNNNVNEIPIRYNDFNCNNCRKENVTFAIKDKKWTGEIYIVFNDNKNRQQNYIETNKRLVKDVGQFKKGSLYNPILVINNN